MDEKEYQREYQKAYRAKNRKKCLKKQAEWKKNNAGKVAAYNAEYYVKKTIDKRRAKKDD